jgi:hypothetical protein
MNPNGSTIIWFRFFKSGYSMFSEVFWTGLYTSAIGLIIAVSAQCYKSKCKEISCGCIKILRDIQAEEDLDMPSASPNPIQSQSTL